MKNTRKKWLVGINVVIIILLFFSFFFFLTRLFSNPVPGVEGGYIENFIRSGFPFHYLDQHKGLCCSGAFDYSFYVIPFVLDFLVYIGVLSVLYTLFKRRVGYFISCSWWVTLLLFFLTIYFSMYIPGLGFDDNVFFYKGIPKIEELDCRLLNCVPEKYQF